MRGRIALPGREPAPGQVGIAAGRIAVVIGPDDDLNAARRLDCGDALVLPGVVDVHVHTSSSASEGIEACTRAAAAGGVTTVVDMPYDHHRMVVDPDSFAAKAAEVRREAVVPVGVTCRLCERMDCEQRALPPLQHPLTVNENVRGVSEPTRVGEILPGIRG